MSRTFFRDKEIFFHDRCTSLYIAYTFSRNRLSDSRNRLSNFRNRLNFYLYKFSKRKNELILVFEKSRKRREDTVLFY